MFGTIVGAATLREHLGDARWAIVDCRHSLADFGAGRRAYEAAHIPGAFFADNESDLAGARSGTNGRHPLPDRAAFAAYLRSIGVGDGTQLVAYDAGGDMFAARFWFLARWIGHEAVAVLDGGLAAWEAAGYPTTGGREPAPEPGDLEPRTPLDATLDAGAVARAADAVLIDARAPERYRGEVEPIDPVAGHIPGARNRWFKENYDADGRFKSPDVLRAELNAYGDPARVVNYCGSGVSAAVNMLAYAIAGLPGARLYPGGWSEWCATHPSGLP